MSVCVCVCRGGVGGGGGRGVKLVLPFKKNAFPFNAFPFFKKKLSVQKRK